MNDRIRELAVQAWKYANETVGHREFGYHDAFEQKFAGLLVKECAGIYSKIDNGNLHMGTDDYLEALQKHFGVEE